MEALSYAVSYVDVWFAAKCKNPAWREREQAAQLTLFEGELAPFYYVTYAREPELLSVPSYMAEDLATLQRKTQKTYSRVLWRHCPRWRNDTYPDQGILDIRRRGFLLQANEERLQLVHQAL